MPSPDPFADFLQLFPVAELPLQLGEDSYRAFEQSGKLLPDALVAEFVAPLEPGLDEYTELLSVARLSTKGFAAVVYWKAGLLHNHYRLVTYDATGQPVDHRVVAGSYIEGAEVVQSAATLTPEHQVYVVSGRASLGTGLGSAADSSALVLGFDDAGLIREVGERPESEGDV